ncbi:hypothetical protein CRC_02823 [Cylindrospermopsis raciborskii CS-505]|nr:hypothetical protein CRC_02823 [Cylindrospermopsis raciborskii CS-505]
MPLTLKTAMTNNKTIANFKSVSTGKISFLIKRIGRETKLNSGDEESSVIAERFEVYINQE